MRYTPPADKCNSPLMRISLLTTAASKRGQPPSAPFQGYWGWFTLAAGHQQGGRASEQAGRRLRR